MSKPTINVTPLIDVLLVLLIIFMVVSPLKPASFQTRVPEEPKMEPVRENPETIVLTVNLGERIVLNKENLGATVQGCQPLIDRLKAVFSERERNLSRERTVFIKAPKDLDYGSVVKVVDAAKLAGAHPISLQIDRLD